MKWQMKIHLFTPPHSCPQLRAYFLPDLVSVSLVNDSGVWHDIDPETLEITKTTTSPSNWLWDDYAKGALTDDGPQSAPRWWRAWAIIDSSDGPWRQWEIGEPNVALGEGRTIGSTATVGEVEGVRRILHNGDAITPAYS